MTKLKSFENYLINEGLELVKEHYLKDIELATAKGKNHIFSPQYIEIIIKETKEKINKLKYKNR